MKVLITGGHLAPALALVDAILENSSHEIVFVGRKYSLDYEDTESLEYKEVARRKIRFIHLSAGRFSRVFNMRSVQSVVRVPMGFWDAYHIVSSQKPDIIVSFGGYIALPIAFWGFILSIPVYTHEQTIHPGLTNRILGMFAKKVFLSFKDASRFFSSKKIIITGNPVRKKILHTVRETFKVSHDKPVIYVTGGSLGSHSINAHVKELLPKLLGRFSVIHQTGDTKEYHDFEDLKQVRNRLSPELKKRYILRKHFFDDEIGHVYNSCDFVVGRAGANTFFECVALSKPALFIPLPWSSFHEQEQHADIFKSYGTGEVFRQHDSSDILYKDIIHMSNHLEEYRSRFKALHYLYHPNATDIIIREIFAKD